jgi:hypothetical protein
VSHEAHTVLLSLGCCKEKPKEKKTETAERLEEMRR